MRSTFLKLHLSILLAGFTGLFGKLVTLNEGLLVCYRMLFTALILFLILRVRGKIAGVSLSDAGKIAGTGCLLALHWVFFFGSIKQANISIGVICFSLVSFFTAWLEPLICRRRVSVRELLLSLISVCGILLIFRLDSHYRTGILLGVISSALAALFTIVNKKVGAGRSTTVMLQYEMAGGCLLLLCLMPLYLHFFPVETIFPAASDLLWLLALSFFCTIGLYLLQIEVLKTISAFTVNLSYNLEPVYSIILAMLLFGEAKELTSAFYSGLGLIILSVALQTFQSSQSSQSS
ncbi:MAG: DMT family transporter [Tannerellaceae bacterium]|jgi:drug/metabolite transporter (DMT)-like permease|nr:DMT family transporter [Tannerellaceae bacterium]